MKIFCSARDQEARVVLNEEPIDDAHAELADLELVCREIGEKCTGSMCPVCAAPPAGMDVGTAHSELADTSHAYDEVGW